MLHIYEKIGTCFAYSHFSRAYEKIDVYTCNALIAGVSKDRKNIIFYFDTLQNLKVSLSNKKNLVKQWLKDFKFYPGVEKTTYGTKIKNIVDTLNKGGIKAEVLSCV